MMNHSIASCIYKIKRKNDDDDDNVHSIKSLIKIEK